MSSESLHTGSRTTRGLMDTRQTATRDGERGTENWEEGKADGEPVNCIDGMRNLLLIAAA